MVSENKKDKFEARNYQLRIVEYIAKRNGIVYLPTGSGKTYVAILALKRFSQYFDRSIEEGGQRALFICNTVELARQQAVAVRRHTNFKVGFYAGELGVDNWQRSKWTDEIRDNQVLVGTAQVILDMFLQKHMELKSVSIVIIDECHHGTGHHPYHEFMRLFQMQQANGMPLPRVLGLTGVLIKGNEIKMVAKKLRELETTYRGNIVTVSDMNEIENVMLHSTKPRECLVPYHNSNQTFVVIEEIRTLIANFVKSLDLIRIPNEPVRMTKNLHLRRDSNKKSSIKLMLNDFLYQLDNYGIYAGSIAILSVHVEFDIKRRQSETIDVRNAYRLVVGLCDKIRHMLVNQLTDDDDDEKTANTEDVIMNFSTPKVQRFLQYLKVTFANKNPKDICCLVFVERRYTCKCIYGVLLNYIAAVPELRNVLAPQFMVGRNSNCFLDCESVLERRWLTSAIQQFRDGKVNLIVCSSVLEEGIDVQACNYVLILDPIKTFNMYVQTKGRARTKNASFVLFASEMDKPKISQQIQQYRETHAEISQYLSDRVLERSDPELDEIHEHFQDQIKPYVNKNGAVLLASSALSLIHRYVQQIPTDVFGIVLPWFKLLEPNERKEFTSTWQTTHIVSVTLPLNSPLRDTIYGDPMSCARWAKISAAFKACIKLHELGELNERFLPKTVNERIADIANVHFDHWKKYGDDVTFRRKDLELKTKNINTYDTRCPSELYNAMPRLGETCYAYEIILESQFERNDYTFHIYDSLQTRRNYALLLRKRLPRLAEMPLFSHQGKLHVRVSEQPQKLIIETQQQLDQLQHFHVMIFRDILRIWQPFFVLDRRNEENSFLVVPLSATPGGGLDWPLVEQFCSRLPKVQATTVTQRKAMPPPNPKDFEGKVVTQWYANYDEKRMLVTKVHTDLTAMSMMADKQQENSYYKFTMSKYSNYIGDIVHKDHFLLEVRELTDQMNFYVQQRMKTSAQSKIRSKVMLIPELCFNFGFPGDLWVKLLFLPSILRRVHYMLHAEALRLRINKYLGLDQLPQNGSDYRPRPLEIDWSLRRNVDHQGNAMHDLENEGRSLLEPLPTKSIEMAMDNLQITDLETPWQQYMEPIDIDRNIMNAYPVELMYLYKFTRGTVLSLDKLEIEDKEMWTQTQFKMREGNIYSCQQGHNLPALPSINNANDDNRSQQVQLSVLQRSISNEHITPAEQSEFLAAITYAGSVDVFDMERFELLGDCFLKLSATLYLASKYPKWNEGTLTQVKSTLVSNRNLLHCIRGTDIPARICFTLFTPKYTWLPPGLSLPQNVQQLWQEKPELAALIGPHNLRNLTMSEEEVFGNGKCAESTYNSFVDGCRVNQSTHHAGVDFSGEVDFCVGQVKMPNKVLADTLEALLGVIIKNYGLQNGFRMLEYFGICKPDIGKPLTQLLDLQLGSTQLRTNISKREVDEFLINHSALERNLGYTFRDRAYLLQALTHPSNPTNRLTGCYQELEFVGDAILDFLISAYIFEHKTRMTPGQLTDLRSALVNNTTLACICVRHRFHFFILAENALLSESIQNFVRFQETQNHRVTNQVRILMEECDFKPGPLDSDDELEMAEAAEQQGGQPAITADATKPKIGEFNLSTNVDVPKTLGDVVEALIAAVYLDCRDLNTTWQVVYKLFEPELLEFSRNVPLNPIRQLNDHKSAKPIYSPPVIDKNHVMVTCQFICMEKTIKVYGFGSNGKQAKLSAAKHALQKIAKCEA